MIQYHCRMKAVVDTGSITDQLRQDRAELEAAVQRNMELEKEVERVNAEMTALKEQYGKAGSETARQEIQHEVNRNEVDFESNQLVVKALEQRRAGDKEGALDSLKKSLELNPRNIAAYNTIGGIYIELREYAKAVEIFQKLQSVAPAHTASYVNMGVAYAEMGEYHKAIPYYKKALSMDWSDYSRDSKATTYADYGMVYLQMDEREKAYNMFRRALDISPENADALGGLGRYYYEIDEFQTAVKYLEKAVAIDQSDPKDYVNLGLSYSELKEYAKGKEAHRKALKIDSKCVEAYVGLGSIYRDEKQFEKAIDCYNRAVEFAKDKDSLYHAYMSRCVCYCLMKS
ncbi:Tetratricopeptide repeat-containing protein [Selenomonas sp. KH1T6]|nr:Tetratricopeptide repeat-containing protein [Selenomonas ruminantium]